MAFPQDVQDIKVEIELDGVWTDISTDVRRNPGITIKRGRANESTHVEASSCELAIDNTTGNYSPRNPVGDYFGTIGRNTPIRVSILSDKSWMPLDENTGEAVSIFASTPDSASLSIVGDIDIRFEADLDSWYDNFDLVHKWTTTGNQRSYGMSTIEGGYLTLYTSSAGTATTVNATSTVTLPTIYGHQAFGATMDVNNGAAGNTVTFYTSDSIDGTWTQLGAAVVTSGTTSIFNSTSLLYVGSRSSGGATNTTVRGKVYAAEVRDGIAGTVVASPDFTVLNDTDTSFRDEAIGGLTGSTATAFADSPSTSYLVTLDADAADILVGDLVVLTNSVGTYKEQTIFTVTTKVSGFGFTNISYTPASAVVTMTNDIMKEIGNIWTLTGTEITNRDYRARQEVSAWPQDQDTSGNDIYTSIQAGGILRRLGQGQSPVPSSIYRTVSTDTGVVAYWPAEDGENATSLASAFSGHQPMVISGEPELADNSTWKASGALPTMALASFTGTVPVHTVTDNVQAKFYMSIPAGGITTGTVIATVITTGTARRWDLIYSTGGSGSLSLSAYDESDVSILTGGAADMLVNGRPVYVSMRMVDSGTGVEYTIVTVDASTGGVLLVAPATLASRQMGRAVKLIANPQKLMNDVVMGHFSVQSDADYTEDLLSSSVLAWAGESAAERIKRLCAENSVPFFQLASVENTDAMGPQLVGKTLLQLLQECADTDMGILYEPRDLYGLTYRPRTTLTNQPAVVTASHSANQLTAFKPVDDDQSTVNDVKVTRIGGSSYRAVDTASALSINEPPNGVGIYDQSKSLSMHVDARLPDQAGWRLHLGTVDEARYPRIGFTMTSPSFLASANLTFDLLALDIGDRLVITDLPAHLPPDDVQQIAQGFTEYLANFERAITVNCTPASVWDVGVYALATASGAGQSKYSSDGTVTTEALDATETGIDISTPSGPVWTTVAAEFPFDILIGGERITVAGITGTGTAQVMTPVTRSVNGVVKSHDSGATVTLFTPAVYGL